MKAIVVAILTAVGTVCGAAEPNVKITLGIPSLTKNVEGLLDYPAKITNNGTKSVWVCSVAGDSSWLSYSAYTRRDGSAKWEILPYAACGAAASLLELKPGASFSFRTSAPKKDIGHQYKVEVRVDISVAQDLTAVEVASPAVTIPRVEQAGAGQPATNPEAKPEGDQKPQLKSEGRSR